MRYDAAPVITGPKKAGTVQIVSVVLNRKADGTPVLLIAHHRTTNDVRSRRFREGMGFPCLSTLNDADRSLSHHASPAGFSCNNADGIGGVSTTPHRVRGSRC